MSSKYLSRLNSQQREELINNLHYIQQGICFITQDPIDLKRDREFVEIDHVIPLANNGKDDLNNFALTFSVANRTKQAADLHVARILYKYKKIVEETRKDAENPRNPNLGDILKRNNGAKYQTTFSKKADTIKFSFLELHKSNLVEAAVYKDNLSGMEYFFANFPIEYLHHDDVINPRTIGSNIYKLVQEFYSKNPQLHISLAWIDINNNGQAAVKIFDGQHKAAAQMLLGVKEIPVRIFINPNLEKLTETNYKAGSSLRQIAFDKSIQRRLGSGIYKDRVARYQKDKGLDENDLNFSEKDLVNFFKGGSREMKRYILDDVRNSIISDRENKLIDYVHFGGREKEKPLSYSNIDKTFFSLFICQEMLETNLDYKQEQNPRELEKSQIVKLMNIFTEELLVDKFDSNIGTDRIEYKIQKGESIPSGHVRALRMLKEEILSNWLKYVRQVIQTYFLVSGKPVKEEILFHEDFSPELWNQIRNFISNMAKLTLWENNQLSETIFGAKQSYSFWHKIFASGKTPDGTLVLSKTINTIEMIKE